MKNSAKKMQQETDEMARLAHEIYEITNPCSWRYEERSDRLYLGKGMREILELTNADPEWYPLADYYKSFVIQEDGDRMWNEAQKNREANSDGATYYYRVKTRSGIKYLKAVVWLMKGFRLGFVQQLHHFYPRYQEEASVLDNITEELRTTSSELLEIAHPLSWRYSVKADNLEVSDGLKLFLKLDTNVITLEKWLTFWHPDDLKAYAPVVENRKNVTADTTYKFRIIVGGAGKTVISKGYFPNSDYKIGYLREI